MPVSGTGWEPEAGVGGLLISKSLCVESLCVGGQSVAILADLHHHAGSPDILCAESLSVSAANPPRAGPSDIRVTLCPVTLCWQLSLENKHSILFGSVSAPSQP